MRFNSKVDGWLIPVIVIAIAGMLAAFVAVLIEDTPLWLKLVVSFTSVLFCGFLFAVLMSTYYVVADGVLRIVSGPFRWKVAISDIVEITPTRNPVSSPALSLDRLKISYGNRRFVLVSPADKDGFNRAIELERSVS
ncbi:MAG: PH domain-containing protein [Woeseiaceae bacterium]|nr:PH domain-containing protein [Woeseiaceae bacterium]